MFCRNQRVKSLSDAGLQKLAASGFKRDLWGDVVHIPWSSVVTHLVVMQACTSCTCDVYRVMLFCRNMCTVVVKALSHEIASTGKKGRKQEAAHLMAAWHSSSWLWKWLCFHLVLNDIYNNYLWVLGSSTLHAIPVSYWMTFTSVLHWSSFPTWYF